MTHKVAVAHLSPLEKIWAIPQEPGLVWTKGSQHACLREHLVVVETLNEQQETIVVVI